MTYQFLCDYLYHFSQTIIPSKRKHKLTLDNISYKILIKGVCNFFSVNNTQNMHNSTTVNTPFGEVQVIRRPIAKLYHKLEIL